MPLNVTDGVIGKDGNFYFAVGGRGTPSALYRVKYVGDEDTDWRARGNKLAYATRMLRREMEELHQRGDAGAIDKIWPKLGHTDRSVRFAARVALEHQPVAAWVERALAERDPQTALSALLARDADLAGAPRHAAGRVAGVQDALAAVAASAAVGWAARLACAGSAAAAFVRVAGGAAKALEPTGVG